MYRIYSDCARILGDRRGDLGNPGGLFWGDGAEQLNLLPKLIIRALRALAAPLVVLAILSAIVTNEIRGRLGALMMAFYLVNTLVAMVIGLLSLPVSLGILPCAYPYISIFALLHYRSQAWCMRANRPATVRLRSRPT